jgi:hypothetical protein
MSRLEHPRQARRRRQNRRRRSGGWIIAVLIVVAAVIAVVVIVADRGSSTSATAAQSDAATAAVTGPEGPEGVPLQVGTPLAAAATPAAGQTVDGIQCQSSEQAVYHVHSHLAVYVNGQLRPIPAGIGIVEPAAEPTGSAPFYGATDCYYWLHVHTQDGVIHIESPTVQSYTLGQFFALWGQPLNGSQVGPASGTLQVFVDGRPYQGNPADIVLGSHEDIQINVGSPSVAPQRVDWASTGL